LIVAIGGGITGDIAGYVASTFMRGIKYIQIPTTLLSMVDSSVGGKTGVNFRNQKNMIGTFYQPEYVAVYPEFISTLPKRELQSGAGEIFKNAFLADIKNYNFLKKSLLQLFSSQSFDEEKTIYACLKIKSNIVENDEKEITGLRKILNLGHTFAHAFEVESNFKLKHGEAVVGGIYCALFLSENLGYITQDKLNKFLNDFNFIKPDRKLSLLNSDSIFTSMSKDKKSTSGKKRFVLINDIGNIVVDVVSEKSSILRAIEKMNNLI
jgi:3-dehydroquinate synthase